MANNTSCRAGKTIVVDPNAFDGQSSSSNIFVPLEDLSISVQLETRKKPRTVLTTSAEGIENKSNKIDGVSITFIEGGKTNGNGEKVLTTKYTDLTTSFDSSSENLGITSIEIDFNSSYAPLISITFIDLRGSAIFQDEENIKNGINKYATFFQLPYPLYDLTIKGYYGMPVKYNLHMTKFNAKFNSQTGNFEIIANFVGYTYAMLSDMLLGYLIAIPYTKIGKAKYKKIRETNSSIQTLNELYKSISLIDVGTQKISKDDPDAIDLAIITEKKDDLDTIKTNLNILGQDIDLAKEVKDEYKFILVDSTLKNLETAKKTYIDAVKINIDKFNVSNTFKIDDTETSEFTTFFIKSYKKVSISILKPTYNKPYVLQQIFGDNYDEIRIKLYEYIRAEQYIIGDEVEFEVYDLRNLFKILETKKAAVEKHAETLRVSLSKTIRETIKKTIGVDPTVKNIIEVFTTAAEVFLSVIFDVSAAAKSNTNRTIQLSIFKDTVNKRFDYQTNTNASPKLKANYYPWPDYRNEDEKKGLTEEYLGKDGVLLIPSDVDELVFIDDLLKAFLTASEDLKNAELILQQSVENWVGCNPLDTRIFGIDKFPYKRIEGNSYNEIINLIMIRGMTYFFSNKKLKKEEIIAIANLEIDSLIANNVNDTILKALTQAIDDTFISTTGKIDGTLTKVINGKLLNNYYYNYIKGNDSVSASIAIFIKLLPINGPFDGFWLADTAAGTTFNKLAKEGRLFLGNFTTTDPTATGVTVTKLVEDGSIYVKMINPSDYSSNKYPISQAPTETLTILDYSALSLVNLGDDGGSVGFNPIGGGYGVQEFFTMNYNDSESRFTSPSAPFRLCFFTDTIIDKTSKSMSNGLGLKRKESGTSEFGASTKWGRNKLFSPVPDTLDDIKRLIDLDGAEWDDWKREDIRLYKDFGSNRTLLNELFSDSKKVTFPIMNFQIEDSSAAGSFDVNPISLFGSRLYNKQDSDYSKALLFLHSFPWNGLAGQSATGVKTTIFDRPVISNTFSKRAGFISAPKLWVAFIGAMIWRMDPTSPKVDTNGVIIGGGSGPIDPIKWSGVTINGNENFLPKTGAVASPTDMLIPLRNQYLTGVRDSNIPATQMCFVSSNIFGQDYKSIDDIIRQLPKQASDEFKNAFLTFVKRADGSLSDWDKVKAEFQVYAGPPSYWETLYNQIVSPISVHPYGGSGIKGVQTFYGQSINQSSLDTVYGGVNIIYNNILEAGFSGKKIDGKLSLDNYYYFTPLLDEDNYKYNYFCGFNDDSTGVQVILDLLTSETIIANMSYKIWDINGTTNSVNPRESISVSSDDMTLYVETILNKLNSLKDGLKGSVKKKEAEQEIFGTSDDNIIKLQLYRTCKNTYDKWVGGASDGDNIIFQSVNRNALDNSLASISGRNTPRLIDSFRFVTSSFRDIGNELVINPLPVGEYISDNPNANLYDCITNLLSANNFDFIPLPTYINYGDPETLESMFKPMTSEDGFKSGTTGPAFVCVYVGQTSKHLDLGGDEYPNDGFDFKCVDGGLSVATPKRYTDKNEAHENKVAVFAVNYGQQNQNIFKDITLDQSEFTETAESLRIISDIADKGAETKKSFGGQNLYNVYSVRSYKTEVEMMGNAMIQPMMYFQLNNIPMFHGAYMITHVKHSIKPNSMSTHFTGVRIRAPETDLITEKDLFMSLIDSFETSNVKQSESTRELGSSGTGPYSLGEKCGSNEVPVILGTVSNSETFIKSKPVRDLVASVESGSCDKNYNAYNYYDSNGKLHSVLPCSKGGGTLKPLEMTIGQIKTEQAAKKIFACGKYQLIPDTFNAMVKTLGLSPSIKFDEKIQERAGEWLIFEKKYNLKLYFKGNGSEEHLTNAITDLGEEFASLPSYHMVVNNKVQRKSIIGYNSNTAVYGGLGGNAAKSKYCAQDVAKILIQTWKNYHPNVEPEFGYDKVISRVSNPIAKGTIVGCKLGSTPMTFNNKSTAVIMGSSSVGTLSKLGLTTNNVAISYNCVGERVPWLVTQLINDGKDTKYINVRTVYVAIGTNDYYIPNSVTELDTLIKTKFPNAKKVILPGTYGWGDVTKKAKIDQDGYYANFTKLGWVYQYPPAPATAFAKNEAEAHNSDSLWFKGLFKVIIDNKPTTIV